MSLVISKVFTYDTDAGDYIQRVEGASGDNQALEPATRQAINNFVIGCKQDGIWNAIKASCILAGARTLNGALQPLVGTDPTNVGFVGLGTDYVRKTGLVGDGSTKYLSSNRRCNEDPQNNFHLSVYKTLYVNSGNSIIGSVVSPFDLLDTISGGGGVLRAFSRSDSSPTPSISMNGVTGLMGHSRSSSSTVSMRGNSTTVSGSSNSSAPSNALITIFARNGSATVLAPQLPTSERFAFYSIGESLDLALLDARVTALITAFGVAIP